MTSDPLFFAAQLRSRLVDPPPGISSPPLVPTPRPRPGWVQVRLFCSSTFRDMLAERSILNTVVLPELTLWGRARCIEFSLVDLVWGVAAGTAPRDVIATCLRELSACTAANGAPYLIYLGGQRYGWAPTAEDLGPELSARYGCVPGASITATEVVVGGLGGRNPNALYCLRDPAFAEGKGPDFADTGAERARQDALLSTVVAFAGEGQVVRYTLLPHEATAPGTATTPPSSSASPLDAFDAAGFAAAVTAAVKRRVEQQYPPVAPPPPGLATSRLQHALAVETLAEGAVPRVRLLAHLEAAVDSAASTGASEGGGGGGGRLLVVGAPSGNGKSSTMAQLCARLSARGGAYTVVPHFVGTAERSDELGGLARRVTGELLRAWGRPVEEGKLPDDTTEACALTRQTLLDGPAGGNVGGGMLGEEVGSGGRAPSTPSPTPPTTVLVIDAINQVAGDAERVLDWLPSAEDCAALPPGLVVVVSCTPGRLLDQLRARAPPAAHLEVGPLDAADALAITIALLERTGKTLDGEQMSLLLSNPGASSPLWLALALFRLRQVAKFETLTLNIASLPPSVADLIALQLKAAEEALGESLVGGLLLAAALSRCGLREGEALAVLPTVAWALEALHGGGDGGDGGGGDGNGNGPSESAVVSRLATGPPAPDGFALDFARLRAAVDAFLRPTAAGAPLLLAPSHAVVHAAILARYTGGNAALPPARCVRRVLACFFEAGGTGSFAAAAADPARRAVEGPWARLHLRDGPGLARILCDPAVMRQIWVDQGDAGRWELLVLWRDVGLLQRGAPLPGEEGEGEGETGKETEKGEEKADVEDKEDASDVAGDEVKEEDDDNDDNDNDDDEKKEGEYDAAVRHLLAWAGSLAEGVMRRRPGAEVDSQSLALIRAIFELLVMMRRSQSALGVLEAVQRRLTEVEAGVEGGGEAEGAGATLPAPAPTPDLLAAQAWTQAALGSCLNECGRYGEAASALRSAVSAYGALPGFASAGGAQLIGQALLDLARALTNDSKLDLAFAELARADEVFHAAVTEQGAGGDASPSSSAASAGGAEDGGLPAFLRDGQSSSYTAASAMCDQADVLKEMANVCHDRKEYEAALAYYRRSHALFRRALGDDHPRTARSVWGIGIAQLGLKQLSASLATHVAVLATFRRALGPDHCDTGDMHYNIACLHRDVAEEEEARAADLAGEEDDAGLREAAAARGRAARVSAELEFRASLAIYVKAYGTRHRNVGWTLHDVGLAAAKAGHLAAAVEALERALDIRTETLGPNDPETIDTAAQLKKVREEEGGVGGRGE
jgi:tetratricopeptide (TPR) repeat protein